MVNILTKATGHLQLEAIVDKVGLITEEYKFKRISIS